MGSVFRFDGPLVTYATKFANMMIVSLLWVLCCLPVVTIIPASAALFHTTTKIIRGRGNGVFKDFVRSFVSNLKMGVLLTVFSVVMGLILFTCVDFGRQMEGLFGLIYLIIGLVLMVAWATMVLYLPPVLSRFEGKFTMYIRMSLYISSQRLLSTLGMLVLLLVVAFLTDWFPMVLMVTPGMYADLTCTGMEKGLAYFDYGMEDETQKEETEPEQEETVSALSLDKALDED